MTTLPSRIANIGPTVASLTHQSILPGRILINIPKESSREKRGYNIPTFLKRLPLVEINVIDKDFGPATKWLPALEKYAKKPETQIIVVDDDEIYPHHLVSNYLRFANDHNAVLTLVGWRVPADLNHANRFIQYGAIGDKPKQSLEVDKPTRTDCVQGASTFMIRPTQFNQDVFAYDRLPQEAFFVDDIYVSGYLAKAKIPVKVIPASFRFARMKVLKHLVFSETLHRKENKTHHNNNKMYQFYKKYWWSLSSKEK
ncbi:MAG: hypothetical protein KI790_10400 [Cyclobacteriaceae bacterium]|nr:hypothetical protein [Cyclobacteriaceae bacterium HetDA_MAG_MS6]